MGARKDEEELGKYLAHIEDEKLLRAMAQSGEKVSFSKGDIVIDYGLPLEFVPVLLSGTLRVLREDKEGNEILLYYLQGGESCCLSHKSSQVRVIAEEDTKILMIPRGVVNDWTHRFPAWTDFVVRSYRDRFDDLLETVNSIAFHRLDERLENYLLEKSEVSGSRELRISHKEIAAELNSSREVISRLLKQLEKTGKIKVTRNSVSLSPAFAGLPGSE